jgi:hypothetical protein
MLLWTGHMQFIPKWIFEGIFLFIPLSAAFFILPNPIFSVCLEHFPKIYVDQMWKYHLPPCGAEAWEKWSLGSMLYTLLEYLGYPFFFLQLVQSHFPHIFPVICMSSKPPLTLHIQEMREIIQYCDVFWSHATGSWDALKEVLSLVLKKCVYSTDVLRLVCFPSSVTVIWMLIHMQNNLQWTEDGWIL